MSENIREYNFAIPGNTERHIPGIPGTWPLGSIVLVDEDTKQVISVAEGVNPALLEQDAPPALDKKPAKAK